MEELTAYVVRNEWISKDELNVYITLPDGVETLTHRVNFKRSLVPSENEVYGLFLFEDEDSECSWVLGATNKFVLYYGSSNQNNVLLLKDVFEHKPSVVWDGGLLVKGAYLNTRYSLFRLIDQCGLTDLKETILKSAIKDIVSMEGSFTYVLGELKLPMRFDEQCLRGVGLNVINRTFNSPLKYGIPALVGLLEKYVVNGITLKRVGDHYAIDLEVPVDMTNHVFRL